MGPGKKKDKKHDVHEDEDYGKKRTTKISGSNIQISALIKIKFKGLWGTLIDYLNQDCSNAHSAQNIRDKRSKILFITIYDEFLAV